MYEKIKQDTVGALKNKNKELVIILRSLTAAIQKVVKDTGKELNDALCVDVIKKSIKDLENGKTYAVQAGRQDLVDQANLEIQILGKYLPKTFTMEETEQVVIEAVSTMGATNKSDMGKVMGFLKARFGSHLDMSLTSQIVGEKLS